MIEEQATKEGVKMGMGMIVMLVIGVAGIVAVLGYGIYMAVKHFFNRKAKKEQASAE